MRLVNIDDCNRALFYKQFGGKNSLITVESAFNMLEALPTAYSVENVIEELESKICTIDEDDVEIAIRNKHFRTAIEIVKQSGVSDDVCEWKSGKSNDEWKPSCEPNSTYNVFGVAWFRKCPYCGKKIKVVE